MCLFLFVLLSVKGFNKSKLKVADSPTPITDNYGIKRAISEGDTTVIVDFVKNLEAGKLLNVDFSSQYAAYTFLLEANLLSNDSKVNYAQLKLDNAVSEQDIMVGVTTLLSVIDSDSNNIAALEVLGERSIQSGQFKKAQERYQKLVDLQPQNKEYQKKLEFVEEKLGEHDH